MAAHKSARSRKTTKKAPASRKKLVLKDLPNVKADKIVGGIDSDTGSAPPSK